MPGSIDLICYCKQVPKSTVVRAIEGGARDVDAIGAMVGAGTGCGCCIPDLEALLRFWRDERGGSIART